MGSGAEGPSVFGERVDTYCYGLRQGSSRLLGEGVFEATMPRAWGTHILACLTTDQLVTAHPCNKPHRLRGISS